MQTRHIEEILKSVGLDIQTEYCRLFVLFYTYHNTPFYGENLSLYELCKRSFSLYSFCDTCISLKDYEETCGLVYAYEDECKTANELAVFAEYLCNLLIPIAVKIDCKYYPAYLANTVKPCIKQIRRVIAKLGYTEIKGKQGLIMFVPRDANAIAVAEILQDDDLSYKVIEYNHHSLAGNVEKKREIINRLSAKLEPHRNELKIICSKLEGLLFWAFNNLNIRHNNCSAEDSAKYRDVIAEMSCEELENYYDDVYQLCLQAFISLDNVAKQDRLENLKAKCNPKI